MGRTAFFLRAYNDIDHIAPVIWKFIKKGDNPLVVFYTNIDFENDYRIKFLRSEGSVEILRVLDKEYAKIQELNNGIFSRIKKKNYNLKRSLCSQVFLGKYKDRFSFFKKEDFC